MRPPAILPPRAYSDSAAMNQRAHEVLASNWEEQRGKLQGELDMNAQRLKAAEHCEAQRPQNSEMAAMLQRNAEALRQHDQATFVRPLEALPRTCGRSSRRFSRTTTSPPRSCPPQREPPRARAIARA